VRNVVVIGGGISGLTAGWKLLARGLDVVVLEAQPEAGGNIRTVEHEGFRLELGPYSFLGGSEHVWRLIEELDLEAQTERSSAAADNRYIYRHERLVPLPLGLGSFLTTPLLSWRGKLRLMAEPFIRNGAKPDDTAWEFFVRRFGREAATFIIGPFVSGSMPAIQRCWERRRHFRSSTISSASRDR
jgi:oxygen-dependent protoporphyrinogen oxidase